MGERRKVCVVDDDEGQSKVVVEADERNSFRMQAEPNPNRWRGRDRQSIIWGEGAQASSRMGRRLGMMMAEAWGRRWQPQERRLVGLAMPTTQRCFFAPCTRELCSDDDGSQSPWPGKHEGKLNLLDRPRHTY